MAESLTIQGIVMTQQRILYDIERWAFKVQVI
jgi:hypothetical protein